MGRDPLRESWLALVATMDDIRNALFHLAISPEWMLTDTEENEIRPANPGQMQPASMQQFLEENSSAGPLGVNLQTFRGGLG